MMDEVVVQKLDGVIGEASLEGTMGEAMVRELGGMMVVAVVQELNGMNGEVVVQKLDGTMVEAVVKELGRVMVVACGTCPFALEWLPKASDFVANKFAFSFLCVSEMASNDI